MTVRFETGIDGEINLKKWGLQLIFIVGTSIHRKRKGIMNDV